LAAARPYIQEAFVWGKKIPERNSSLARNPAIFGFQGFGPARESPVHEEINFGGSTFSPNICTIFLVHIFNTQ